MKTKTEKIIPLEEHKRGFKNWKEVTTTSSSVRHLGHVYSLFKLDGTQYSEKNKDFSERMLALHHKISSIALLDLSPLN